MLSKSINRHQLLKRAACTVAGEQGKELMTACLKIPCIRFRAVCDIWTTYNQKRASGQLRAYGHPNNKYVDYRQMLDKEKDLDAVIIAPPAYELPVKMDKKYHQPHLEKFFDAVRGRAKLNCPAETGYESAVAVLKVNEAIEQARKLKFKPEEFKCS